MILLTPQPNQSFHHVPPAGNSYHSGADRVVTPLTIEDEASLVALGCVPVPAAKVRPPRPEQVSEDALAQSGNQVS